MNSQYADYDGDGWGFASRRTHKPSALEVVRIIDARLKGIDEETDELMERVLEPEVSERARLDFLFERKGELKKERRRAIKIVPRAEENDWF